MSRPSHPALFQPDMVAAILAGRKTMTRRLAWGEGIELTPEGIQRRRERGWRTIGTTAYKRSEWQNYQIGDLLYVREHHWRWGTWRALAGGKWKFDPAARDSIAYEAEAPGYVSPVRIDGKETWTKKPGMHHPRALSRLTLEIVSHKIERLQDISDRDALDEGIVARSHSERVDLFGLPAWPVEQCVKSRREAFGVLWRSINGTDSWNDNPEVVAVGFKVHRCNVDKFEG